MRGFFISDARVPARFRCEGASHSWFKARYFKQGNYLGIWMKLKVLQVVWVVAFVLFLVGCTGEVNGVPEPEHASDKSVAIGRRLIASYGCGTCHAIPGVPGANAMAAPPLKCFYQRTYIAGRLANTKTNLIRWIQNPQQVEPGTAMPDLGVSEDEASDIADYLYDPPAYWGLIPGNVVDRKCSP
jgi:cytochrome c2